MRPLHLVLSGFRSHAGTTEIDFDGRRFIAIVGPTGAGKSSILDGISYALYARTPVIRLGSGRLVCTRCERAKVSFRFALDDRVFEVNRTIPAASDDRIVDLGSGEEVVGATNITRKVEELLGLEFDGFSSSALLAQGQFAQFLKAGTTERTKILKGIFRIEQVDALRDAAKGRLSQIKVELGKIEGARHEIGPDLPDRLKAAKAEAAELAARSEALREAVPEEAALLERVRDAEQEVKDAGGERSSLELAFEKIPSEKDLEAAATRALACQREVTEADAALKRRGKALEDAETALSKLEDEIGKAAELNQAVVKAKNLAELAQEVVDASERIPDLEARLAELEEAAAAGADSERAAKEVADAARRERSDLERLHSAHVLRKGLAPGDPCPVCEQIVGKVPASKAPKTIAAATKSEEKAEAALEEARRGTAEARHAVAGHRAALTQHSTGLAKSKARLAEHDTELRRLVGKVADPAAEIAARLDKLGAAESERREALGARDEAREALDSCTATQARLARERRAFAPALIELAARTSQPVPDMDGPVDTLLEQAKGIRVAAMSRMTDLGAALEKASVVVREANEALVELRDKLGTGGASISDVLSDLKGDARLAEERVADLSAKLKRAKELDDREKELKARRATFVQLADDLRNETFINFLLEDRRRSLSDLASERLYEMTSSHYRFSDDGEFNIMDELEGGRVRGSDTLSGGETFLASLALALGLAETATRHGGRLQCFFLDEGFGSLDPESFDLALDGIERIVREDRLIALVSHVPALALRVEDKIVLEKDADGMAEVAAGASATA